MEKPSSHHVDRGWGGAPAAPLRPDRGHGAHARHCPGHGGRVRKIQVPRPAGGCKSMFASGTIFSVEPPNDATRAPRPRPRREPLDQIREFGKVGCGVHAQNRLHFCRRRTIWEGNYRNEASDTSGAKNKPRRDGGVADPHTREPDGRSRSRTRTATRPARARRETRPPGAAPARSGSHATKPRWRFCFFFLPKRKAPPSFMWKLK